ncbi:flavin reductase family protein [Dactylosporangium fulvum]|uniref:Flavin reductase family protein n=1 Tax=Dactylosporangium fulvum TaxID=53359 RepID=A0ABY5W5M6_9ACTN|nr:flavin reductase family protein [Dactylosporangium fulvum]UWP84774.1 flavin reductase family protein [Dactylosporangium fulvum]
MTADAMDSGLFRRVLRRHASAVVVVTVPGPVGFTATSFTSVSLDPPLVSFSVARAASVWPSVEAAGLVAVHVLTDDQEQVARIFATPGIDRFAEHSKRGGSWHEDPAGVPLLDGVLAVLICKAAKLVEAGDHMIVIASPVSATHHDDESAAPLVYHAGTYMTLER